MVYIHTSEIRLQTQVLFSICCDVRPLVSYISYWFLAGITVFVGSFCLFVSQLYTEPHSPACYNRTDTLGRIFAASHCRCRTNSVVRLVDGISKLSNRTSFISNNATISTSVNQGQSQGFGKKTQHSIFRLFVSRSFEKDF